MEYPAMNEWQVAHRWRVSPKTLRRWRSSGDGPRWHKLFKLVRYHVADVLEFERRGAQHWTAILADNERVPNIVKLPPEETPSPDEADTDSSYLTAKEALGATGLPAFWLTDARTRAAKHIPHLALVGNVRYSLSAIWTWEMGNSIVGTPPAPKPAMAARSPHAAPGRVPRWFELGRAADGETSLLPRT